MPGLSCVLIVNLILALSPNLHAAPANRPATPYLKTPEEREPMDMVADRFIHDRKTQVSIASGNVFIVYDRYLLKADEVVYERRKNLLKAIGNVWLKEPNGNILKSESLTLDERLKTGFAELVEFSMTNDATLNAARVRREEGFVTIFEQVAYTRCRTCVTASGRPFWELKSDKATYVEKEHRIYHENARMEVLGVPVFWLPRLSHPDPQTKRSTGFLVPRFGYSKRFGAQAEIPYFWNLAPNYDITFRPLFTSRQGPLGRAIWRHHTRYGKYQIDASGIYQLKPKKAHDPDKKHLRGAIQTRGRFDVNSAWHWAWDGTVTSDDTYLKRYKIDGKDNLTSTVHLTGLKGRNYFNTAVHHYRSTIAGENSKTLPLVHPHIQYSLTLDQPVLGGELGFDTASYALTREVGRDAGHWTSDLHWRRRSTSDAGVLITPFARVRGSVATSKNVPDPTVRRGVRGRETTARVMPKAGLDIRWPFVGSGEAARHVITPAAQIVTATSERKANKISNENASVLSFDASNQFLADRFTGFDRFDGGTRADIGLIYEYLMNNGGFVKTSLGQSYRIAGRNGFARGSGLEDTASDFVASAVFQPNRHLRFHYTSRFDAKTFAPRRQEIHAEMHLDRFSLAMNYGNVDASPAFSRPDRRHYLWSQASLRLGSDFRLFGGFRHDLRNDYIVTNHIGLGYECDCADISLMYRQDRTRDREIGREWSIFLSVEFKTLGSTRVGSGVN